MSSAFEQFASYTPAVAPLAPEKSVEQWKAELPAVETIMSWKFPNFGKYRGQGKTFGEVVALDYKYCAYLRNWDNLRAKDKAILDLVMAAYLEYKSSK